MGKKVNLRLYDIDGCLYNNAAVKEKSIIQKFYNNQYNSFRSWLLRHNNKFLKKQITDIQSKKYDKVIVGCGSTRQSYYLDALNKLTKKGASFAPTLPVIQNYFKQQAQQNVVVDPFLMADIYETNPQSTVGENYKKILAAELSDKKFNDFSHTIVDKNKILLIYAQAQRTAVLNPNADIVIDFYDDNVIILDNLKDFFNQNSDLLPSNVTINLHQYAGEKIKSNKPIKGKGSRIDANYQWTIRYMAATTVSGKPLKHEDLTIENLRGFCKNCNSTLSAHPEMLSMQSEKQNMKKLKAFINQEHKDEDESAKFNKNTYTTAKELINKKEIPDKPLIPKSYLKEPVKFIAKKLCYDLQNLILENNTQENTQNSSQNSRHIISGGKKKAVSKIEFKILGCISKAQSSKFKNYSYQHAVMEIAATLQAHKSTPKKFRDPILAYYYDKDGVTIDTVENHFNRYTDATNQTTHNASQPTTTWTKPRQKAQEFIQLFKAAYDQAKNSQDKIQLKVTLAYNLYKTALSIPFGRRNGSTLYNDLLYQSGALLGIFEEKTNEQQLDKTTKKTYRQQAERFFRSDHFSLQKAKSKELTHQLENTQQPKKN